MRNKKGKPTGAIDHTVIEFVNQDGTVFRYVFWGNSSSTDKMVSDLCRQIRRDNARGSKTRSV